MRQLVRFSPLVALTVAALGLPLSPGAAQTVVIDEGTFSHFRENARVGREDFGIRVSRGGAGGAYIAQGNLVLGDQRRAVVLSVDSLGTPLRFQLEDRAEQGVVGSILGERQRGIWSGRIARAGGESAREFRLAPDTYVVEPGIVHTLWFVLQFGEGRPVTLFAPGGPTRQLVSVEEQAPDRVALGLREFVARRWLVRAADSGEVVWEVWTDATVRLLRVRHHPSGLEALRDDPPAETRTPTRT